MSQGFVLLVEDDPNQVELAKRAFSKQGLTDVLDRLVVTRDGQEALDYLLGTGQYAHRDPTVLPEFVLLDVRLPKLSGLEVLKRIRSEERTKLLPVIVYSSSEQDPDVRSAYELGSNSYITKPSDFKRFSEAMRALGWFWLEWNVPPPPPSA
jgi:two-component system response regulator